MSIACGCGEKFRKVAGWIEHRDAGACPMNAPRGYGRFVHWALGIGHERITAPKTEEERIRREEKREKDRQRLEALRSDPVIQEHVRLKREREREENRRRRMKVRAS